LEKKSGEEEKHISFFTLKAILTHCGLATGGIAYSWFSGKANPAHALTAFTLLTAITCIVVDKKLRKIIVQKQYFKEYALSGTFYVVYFYCLLKGLSGAGPSAAALMLSLSICANSLIGIHAKHEKFEKNLIVFLITIVIIILLLKTKGKPTWEIFNFWFFLLIGCVIAEAANTYLRVIWCKKNSVPEEVSNNLAKCGLAFSVFPAIIVLCLDTFFVTGPMAAWKTITSYEGTTYFSWIYLAIIPNIIMLICTPILEQYDPLRYQSVSGAKLIFASIAILYIPSLRATSIYADGEYLALWLTLLLILQTYLYTVSDDLLEKVVEKK
jgi:drug/metabolite transporter (DMT)-like permease